MTTCKKMLTSLLFSALATGFSKRPGYVPYGEPIKEIVTSPRPHTYLAEEDLPAVWDWRNVNGTNFLGHVYSQETPSHCGSCWAEASMSALSDRFSIATGGKLRVNMASQHLLNFLPRTTGGSCEGGDHVKAYEFIHKYGAVDETCAAKIGLDRIHSFHVAGLTDVEEVRDSSCFECNWKGPCGFIDRDEYNIHFYGVDEFGSLTGVHEMKAEIYKNGPIACLINSEPPEFNNYKGGVITCDGPLCDIPQYTDHVIVIAGWGVDEETGKAFWVGRNSYGTKWGEGAGGGWFRLELGKNKLNLESSVCSWAVPAQVDVDQALDDYHAALGMKRR